MTKKSSNNFWNGTDARESRTTSKTASTVPGQKGDKNSRVVVGNKLDFDWRILLGVGVVILLIVVAILINLNHSHNGDNASNIAGSIDIDNGDTKINWSRYETYNVDLSSITSGENYTIKNSGVYYLSGNLSDGAIIIQTTSDGVVKLVLDNVSIKNSKGPGIACLSGDDLVIELVGTNKIEDGVSYSSDFNEDIDGAIYSKADLSFSGDGTLELVANYQDGIVGKDDVKFNSGTYNITSVDDGIRGKDSVYIVAGNFEINAGADAIKSTNETDTTKGFILIEKGEFDIVAGAKGIKAINSILIYGGDFDINSTDDAIHSNNYVGITGGDIEIASSDDGIHADARLIIDGGKIEIAKSYEGLEAQKISINGGDISVVSNDDGINAGGGADASATNRVGAGTFDADENCEIVINGGNVYVNAAGDGIDSNGWTYFNGGTVVVDGPTNNGNGALDSGLGISINGGSVITLGASGMAESLGSSSSVYNVSVYFTSTLEKGTKVEIKNSAGEILLSHTSAKSFNHLAAGTTAFKYGETYDIFINGEKNQSFTISDITTTVGNSNNNFQNMNQGTQRGQTRQ